MTLRPILLAAMWLVAAGVRADETTPQQTSLIGFAESHPACVEWTDGCAVCRRAMSVKCSTPGIACQSQDIVCKAP